MSVSLLHVCVCVSCTCKLQLRYRSIINDSLPVSGNFSRAMPLNTRPCSHLWQILLASESAALTTFITPSGRYQFYRLPFGIMSVPEHFQKRMAEILSGIVSMIDDDNGCTQRKW